MRAVPSRSPPILGLSLKRLTPGFDPTGYGACPSTDVTEASGGRPRTADRTEIYELYARYSWALDTGDTDGYVAMFTDGAEMTEETASGEIEIRKGHEAIRMLVLKFHNRPDFPGHQHQMGQSVFHRSRGPRRPLGRPQLRVGDDQPSAEPPHLHWCGHVRDVVAKVEGAWKFRAKAIMGWQGDVLSRFAKR